MTRMEALKLILEELARAEEKFPTFPTDPIHAAAIVGEEAGELLKEALDYTYDGGRSVYAMRKEAAHTAAMGIRFLVNLHQMKRRPSEQR